MNTKQLNIEISESLFKELEYLSEITEEPIIAFLGLMRYSSSY